MAGPASLPPHYSAFSICFLCILHLVFQPNCFASYCGESAIPFSFEVLPDGHLVLGCSRPNCFGWDAFSRPSANDSNFYRVNKQSDGFFRKALVSNTPKPLGDLESGWYRPQTANCTVGYKRGRCSSPAAADHDHWVGGIAPIFDSKTPLLLRCCRWHGLAQSAADRGLAKVGAGQIVYGGEVLDGERQYAFDYVGDVVHMDGEIRPRYEVQIFRFACLPRPERLAADVDSGVIKEMLEKFTLALPPTESGQHFASSLAAADEGVKPTLETPKHRHNGQSNVIKTSKLSRLPAENNSEKQQQQEINNDYGEEEEEEGDDKQHIQHLGIGRGKAFAAPIQGPFAENEVEPTASADPNLVGEQGPQQHQQIWPQLDRDIHDNVEQPAEVQKAAGGVTRRRIICDRNMTRARRQAECQEVGRRHGVQTKIHIGFLSFPVEIEAPPGTEIQVEDGAYYGPNAGGSGWYPGTWVGGGSQLSCFAADSRIRLANGQQRRMDQLAVGDWVVSANETALVYSIVESWIHRVPNQIAEFVRLELADGRVLKLTGQHFIYRRSNCLQQGIQQKRRWPMLQVFERAELAFAEQVRAGDCLYVGPTETFAAVKPGLVEQPVVRVSNVRDRGIFAPMTSTGNLMVEGVLASCFAVEPNPTLQRSLSWTQMHTQFYQSLGERLEMELPGWLLFVVDHLMPFVVPK